MNGSVPVHSSRWFRWTGPIGTADASNFNDVELYGRSSHFDKCFFVRSERTGITHMFRYEDSERDSEGEIVADIYMTLCKKVAIYIYND